MKLLTSSLLKEFARVGDQSQEEDPLVIAKFFPPEGFWTWYATEYDPENEIFYGYVVGDFPEWGYFSLCELERLRTRMGLPMERDLYFKPKRFSELNLP